VMHYLFKNSMRNILILFLTLAFEFTYSQKLEVLTPKISSLNFSPEVEAKFNSPEAFEDCHIVYKKLNEENRSWNQLTAEEENILKYCDETKGSIWEVEGGGCSWYCGGGPLKITASSYLSSQGDNSYNPKNAHDLNYKNAWVEGVKGYGIGEYLEYHFDAASPRINKVIVVNGYVKSKKSWTDNSRVKKIKMYVNNEPFAILNLEDKIAEQSFDIPLIGNANRTNLELLKSQPNWTIKFEIIDIYKGNKYDDVVISEIYFDGIDVH
ncbi:MAG: NADase-type glycan-binding domain-containing protein, partial [Candidatus Cyclobacteriaceae bacterium M2_1C_046]